MEKREPKKRIPPSGVLKIECVDGKFKRSYFHKEYPQRKKEIEKEILVKFINYINKKENRNIEEDSIKKLKPNEEPPDFTLREKDQNIGIELMELVAIEQAKIRSTNLKYVEEIRKRLNNQLLHIEMNIKKKMPSINSDEGQQLIEKMIQVINFREGKGPPPYITGIYRNHFGGYSYETKEGILGKYTPYINFFPTGMSYRVVASPSKNDYEYWASILKCKWIADYSTEYSKLVLLLYTFEADPDFVHLKIIIESLNSEYGKRFHEIWYLKPYPEGLDDVKNIFKVNAETDGSQRL